jgi:hypothetical protein
MFDIIKTQLVSGILVYPAIVVLLMIFAYLSYRIFRSVYPRPVKTGEEELDKLLSDAGYAYDASQDIFYTKMNAWQRKYGYCRLYDEAAAPAGMIIDSEPVHFEYDGKRWLIQFWKGQYYLNTGCEIGVYYTEEPDLAVPHIFNGTFYKCVDNADRLAMAYTLMKNGRELFHREEKHCWLAGFKPGEFSEPGELSVRIRITFKNAQMCGSFIRALRKIGYQDHEINTNGISVVFLFDRTHTPQPVTRSEETDWIIQRNNERICNRFQEVTKGCTSWPEKLRAIREKEPLIFEALIKTGKTRQIFKTFEKLKGFI